MAYLSCCRSGQLPLNRRGPLPLTTRLMPPLTPQAAEETVGAWGGPAGTGQERYAALVCAATVAAQCLTLPAARSGERREFTSKVKPHDKDAKMKYQECNKMVKQKAFEWAVAGDEHMNSVVDSLDIESMTIEDEYSGPKLEDGKVTITFMKELMQWYKDFFFFDLQ
nr:protein PPP5D1-like [Dasypus novemcinctus]